jgi:autotransporter-associated beta strand protein
MYTGTGPITKMGTGRLELNNSTNTLSGGYIINQGFINLAASNRLGTGAAIPATLNPSWFTFNGGGLTSSNAAAQDLGATRGITIQAGGAWLGASAAGNPITISAPITGTGNLTIANATTTSTPLNTTFNAGGTWILSNTANNWVGNANISAGTLRTGASNVIPDTSIVNLTLAGVTFDLATNNTTETVKSISGTAGTIAIGTGSLTVASPNGETYSSVFTASAGGKFIKNGTGTLTLGGSSTGFNGEMVLNNGKIGIGSSNALGAGSTGSIVTLAGATLANTGTAGRTIPATASVNLSGDFAVDDSLNATPGQILFNGASTIQGGNRTITVSGAGNLAFAGAMGEDVVGRSLTKEGTGKLVLSGANTYSGGTIVNGGTLLANNTTGSGTGSGSITVNGGTFGGTGTVSGSVTVGGTGILSPGSSVAAFATGALSFLSGGSLHYEINSSVALASAADLLKTNGNLSIAAGSLLSLADVATTPIALPIGTKFTMVSYSGTWDGGTFDGAADDSNVTIGLNEYVINYNDTTGGSNFGGGSFSNYVTLTAVPEVNASLLGGLVTLVVGAAIGGRKLFNKSATA